MPAIIHHLDIYGRRQDKYDTLESLSIADADWTEVDSVAPYYFFVPKNTDGQAEYESGFSVGDIFPVNVTGIVTAIDKLVIYYTSEEARELTQKILNSPDPYTEFGIKDQRKHKKEARISELREVFENQNPTKITYRPFDTRYMYYTKKTECWINSPRYEVMKKVFVNNKNIALEICKQSATDLNWSLVNIVNQIPDDSFVSNRTKERWYMFPLYLYSDSESLDGSTRTPNLDAEIWAQIDEIVGETTPEEILDYIYAVLHAPKYREKYKEFLKIDFPRVPYPKSRESFDKLVILGGELRELHLLESARVHEYITTFPVAGSGEVEKISYVDGRVYINSEQYFWDVPSVAWNFYIGGYQPAQKWLKDRKWRVLTWEDISHYQEMIVALTETARVMGEVDEVLEV